MNDIAVLEKEDTFPSLIFDRQASLVHLVAVDRVRLVRLMSFRLPVTAILPFFLCDLSSQ